MKRLTDEELNRAFDLVAAMRPALPTDRPNHTMVIIERLATEVRELRALRLTDEEREALEWARDTIYKLDLSRDTTGADEARQDAAVDALDRLLSNEGGAAKCGVCLDGAAPCPVIDPPGQTQWTCLACGRYVGIATHEETP